MAADAAAFLTSDSNPFPSRPDDSAIAVPSSPAGDFEYRFLESRHQSLEIEAVGCFNIGGHQGWRATGALGGTEDFVMVSGSKRADRCGATNMPDGPRLGTLYSVRKC